MTKLLCPISGCNKTRFGVSNTHQVHINKHLWESHQIRVTPQNRAHYRSQQDQKWNELHAAMRARFQEIRRRNGAMWKAFCKDPKNNEIVYEDPPDSLLREQRRLMNVDEDRDDRMDTTPEGWGDESQRASEWFESGGNSHPHPSTCRCDVCLPTRRAEDASKREAAAQAERERIATLVRDRMVTEVTVDLLRQAIVSERATLGAMRLRNVTRRAVVGMDATQCGISRRRLPRARSECRREGEIEHYAVDEMMDSGGNSSVGSQHRRREARTD